MRKFALAAVTFSTAVWLATSACAASFFFSTGNPDGRLGALSRPAGPGELETETADDFILTDTTLITGATISGLLTSGATLADIANVEVELYHVFPLDSVNPPSGNVPTRTNSPSDVEISSATRDESLGTLGFTAILLNSSFTVANTVVNGINKKPNQTTGGEGPATGEEIQIAITFTPPIALAAGHYFFRPEASVTGGNFLYLSAPRPIVAPGTPFVGDLQAWIRNSALAPDWLRIGTDIIGGATPPTFNMTFSLTGETVPPFVLNSERVQIARSTSPNSDQVNMALTFTENGQPDCDADDDALNSGILVQLFGGICADLPVNGLGLELDPFVVHKVSGQSYGTLFQINGPETVSARMVALAKPAGSCGKWTLNLQVAGLNTASLGLGGTNPFALVLSDTGSDGQRCFDITNAIVGNQIDPPAHSLRRGVRR